MPLSREGKQMTAPADFHPVKDEAWPDEIQDMLTGFAGSLNVHRTIAHHPALLRSIAGFREHVVHATALGPQLSEIAILRTGHRLGSFYEFSHHVVRARARGVSDTRIIAATGPCAAMEPADAVIAGAVDELFDARALSDTSIAVLADLGGRPAVLDLIATVGFYSILGFVLNSFQTPIDPDISAALAERPLPGGASPTDALAPD